MQRVLRVIAIIIIIVTIIWMIVSPGFDALTAFLAGVVTLLTSFAIDKSKGETELHQKKELIPTIKFFFHQETAYFVNKPGRYSDQLKFSIENDSDSIVESLKVDFIFPKLDMLLIKKKFSEFHLVIHNSDFQIQEYNSAYRIKSETYRNLLPGDTINIPRACIIYAINLPDKDKWIEAVKKSHLRLSWTLFSGSSKPQKGNIKLRELYTGDYATIE